MSVYAIGDVQGYLDTLQRLLDRVRFSPARDQLWFVGDLVNRGPDSLGVLRFVRALGDRAITVLGNHDLHLLGVAAGVQPLRKKDTFQDVLNAPDREELIEWLRREPLLHRAQGFTMVHAGIPPGWTVELAQTCARELESALRAPEWKRFLHHMYGDEPASWRDDLKGWERLRYITNALTRMRYCTREGELDFLIKSAPGSQPDGYRPWFESPGRAARDEPLIIGHWSTLPRDAPLATEYNIHHLETGCGYGGCLTAMRLDDLRRFSVRCPTTGEGF